ncbi:flagellar biosynthetic protein FliR [Caldimonas tepidiphila]|uniref:flagellar biosynthetic protein FliR n=1 Tax=Caldimonas tepidiphila TaxID=2315841 RepID=UPI000E5A29C5|nr:flagellar biosynthetic protein FliR [Caldimonas tepidiphila]
MLTFSEAQLLGWISPILWPFVRTLALFSVMPVFSNRTVPVRVRIGLAFFIALAAQAALPPAPVVPLDSAAAFLVLLQQLLIGLSIGFAVRIVFAAVEFAGELVGLQMGLNFASFFDPTTGGQATAVARLFGTMTTLLFLVLNGHLVVIAALVQSFQAFPVSPEPLALLRELQPHRWGAEIFRTGLWIALPTVAMLVFVNLVLGVISRVAQQMNIFAIGFPITLSVGLIGMAVTLPMLEAPFTAVLERMLGLF